MTSGTTVPRTMNSAGGDTFAALALLSITDHLVFLREIAKNAFEGNASALTFGVTNWNGVDRMYALDNGTGFNPSQMGAQLGQWLMSGRDQGIGKNHGVGAKLAALKCSPWGVHYFSKQHPNGPVHHVSLYGSGAPDCPEGGNTEVAELERRGWPANTSWPDEFDGVDSGVMVVFDGGPEWADTSKRPDNAPGGENWISHNLNSRMLTIPDGMTIRDRFDRDPKNWKTVDGQRAIFERHQGLRTGTVTLRVPGTGQVNVEWFLAHENKEMWHAAKRGQCHGLQIACVYDNEAYGLAQTDTAKRRLGQFGIGLNEVAKRATVYLHLDEHWCPDMGRSKLQSGTVELDYAEIGAEFQKKMPDELAEALRKATKAIFNENRGAYQDLLGDHDAITGAWRRSDRGTDQMTPTDKGTVDRPGKPGRRGGGGTDNTEAPKPDTDRQGPEGGSERGYPTKGNGMQIPLVRVVAAREMSEPEIDAEVNVGDGCHIVLVNAESLLWRSTLTRVRSMIADDADADETAVEAAKFIISVKLAGHVLDAIVERERAARRATDVFDALTSGPALRVAGKLGPADRMLVGDHIVKTLRKKLRKT